MENTNPDLLAGFCLTGTKNAIPDNLQASGWTPENPNIHGYQFNTVFNQIFSNLQHLKKKGFSFWESTTNYIATNNDIDFVRRNNKIYYAKQDSLDKTPENNPDFWGVFFDIDNPNENLYHIKGGSATQRFKVANAVNDDEAVSLEQNKLKLDIKDKRVCTAWVVFDGTDGTIKDSYNIESVTKVEDGKYELNFAVDMATTDYVISACKTVDGSSYEIIGELNDVRAVDKATIVSYRNDRELIDSNPISVQVFGGK